MAQTSKNFLKDNPIVRYIETVVLEIEVFITMATKKVFKWIQMLIDYVEKFADTILGTLQRIISDPKMLLGLIALAAVLLDLIFKGRIGIISLIVSTFTTIVGVLVSAGPLVAVLVVTVLIVLFTRK